MSLGVGRETNALYYQLHIELTLREQGCGGWGRELRFQSFAFHLIIGYLILHRSIHDTSSIVDALLTEVGAKVKKGGKQQLLGVLQGRLINLLCFKTPGE